MRLGFEIENNTVRVPSWRQDVQITHDLAEEIARLYGYEDIPMTLMSGETTIGALSEHQKAERVIKESCYALGLSDIITYSFISPQYYDKIRMPEESVLRKSIKIMNPLGEDTSIMRTVSLPSMMDALARNYNSRNERAHLFELATVYHPNSDEQPEEKKILTIGVYDEEFDFFDLKGYVEVLLESLRIDYRFVKSSHYPAYHPGQCAEVYSGPNHIGTFGQVHPTVVDNFGINTRVYAAELDFNTILDSMQPAPKYSPIDKFPSIERDMAVVCDLSVAAGDLVETVRAVSGELLKSCEIFDVYTGDQVSKGKKSVALSLVYRHPDRTLTDSEVDNIFNLSLSALGERFGAVLR